jgi:hypothetical protein
MTRRIMGAAAFAFTLALAGSASAQAPQQVRVGTLNCDVSGGMGMIVGSQKEMRCLFRPSQRGPREAYVGRISRLGVDIGPTGGGRMVWTVFAPTTAPRGALAGNYVGATAGATVGAGVGANVLVGGSNRTVTLQPLSVQGQTGLNVAAGVAELELRPAR